MAEKMKPVEPAPVVPPFALRPRGNIRAAVVQLMG